jgi:uncharacterized protein YecT (DUF1311 family)
MRSFRFAVALAALSFAAGASAAPSEPPRPSQAACDTTQLGAGDLAQCLHAAADKADRTMQETIEAAMKAIDQRQGLLTPQKAHWRRALAEAQALWVTWRDSECQDVAPFEAGMGAKGADPRLSCIIDNDAARTQSLKARYP